MTEKHGMSPEFENLADLLKYVNANQHKILPPEKLQSIKNKNEKKIVEKITPIEDVDESKAKDKINFLIKHHDDVIGEFNPIEDLKETLQKYPHLTTYAENKIDERIDERIDEIKFPSEIKLLEKLRANILIETYEERNDEFIFEKLSQIIKNYPTFKQDIKIMIGDVLRKVETEIKNPKIGTAEDLRLGNKIKALNKLKNGI